ncbi:hypothetical protein Tco_0698521 [Tanacetum coccineum]
MVTLLQPKVLLQGREQVEDISPNTLEAAKNLSKVASLKSRSIDKGRRYKRRKETKSKKVVSSLDFQDHDTAEKINTAGEVNAADSTDEWKILDKEMGKVLCLSEEERSRSQGANFNYKMTRACLAEAIWLESLQKEEEAKQIHLDAF